MRDHGRGRAGRREHAEPRRGLVAGHAGFGNGRHVGQLGRALGRGDGDGAQLARAHVLDGRGHVVEHDRDLVAQEVRHGRRTALVGHVLHVHLGHALEQLARQVDGTAAARRAEVDLARVGLGVGDQLLHRLERLRGVGDQQVGHVGHAGQGREVLHGIERHLPVERCIDGVRAHRAHEERVAVGGRACRHLAADVAARAGTVVHHHRLAQLGAHALGDDARQDVGGAAGRERHDDGDGLARERLGGGEAGQQGAGGSGGDQAAAERGVGDGHGLFPRISSL